MLSLLNFATYGNKQHSPTYRNKVYLESDATSYIWKGLERNDHPPSSTIDIDTMWGPPVMFVGL